MILVTLGTQDKPFTRLLDAIQKQINNGNIKEKVVVQAGSTTYKSDDMEIFDLIPVDQFKKLIAKADLIITHGGVGSIMEGIKNNKRILAAPRLAKYNEHVNDHQIQIVDEFYKMGYILPLKDFNRLDKLLVKIKKFKPRQFESNNDHIVNMIEEYIDQF